MGKAACSSTGTTGVGVGVDAGGVGVNTAVVDVTSDSIAVEVCSAMAGVSVRDTLSEARVVVCGKNSELGACVVNNVVSCNVLLSLAVSEESSVVSCTEVKTASLVRRASVVDSSKELVSAGSASLIEVLPATKVVSDVTAVTTVLMKETLSEATVLSAGMSCVDDSLADKIVDSTKACDDVEKRPLSVTVRMKLTDVSPASEVEVNKLADSLVRLDASEKSGSLDEMTTTSVLSSSDSVSISDVDRTSLVAKRDCPLEMTTSDDSSEAVSDRSSSERVASDNSIRDVTATSVLNDNCTSCVETAVSSTEEVFRLGNKSDSEKEALVDSNSSVLSEVVSGKTVALGSSEKIALLDRRPPGVLTTNVSVKSDSETERTLVSMTNDSDSDWERKLVGRGDSDSAGALVSTDTASDTTAVLGSTASDSETG